MKLAFSSLGCPQDRVDDLLQRARELGADGVELRTLESTVKLWELEDFSESNLPRTREKFRAAGIVPVVVGSSGSFAAPESEKRKVHMEQLERYCMIAQGLGCPYVRVFGGPIPAGQSRERTVELDLEGYCRAAELAQAHQVTLLFETHDDFSRSDWMLPLLRGLDGKAGVIWDILHPYRFGEAMTDTWNNLAPYVRHVHIKDSMQFSTDGFDIASIGTGRVPIGEALKILNDAGYQGYFCYEWEKHWHPEIESAQTEFPRYMRYMRQFAAEGR